MMQSTPNICMISKIEEIILLLLGLPFQLLFPSFGLRSLNGLFTPTTCVSLSDLLQLDFPLTKVANILS